MPSTLWLLTDVFSMLHTYMRCDTLIKISMVNKIAKQLIDSLCHNQFAASRTFMLGRNLGEFPFKYNSSSKELFYPIYLSDDSLAHFIFSSHIYPVYGTNVHLKHSVMIPATYCTTTENHTHVFTRTNTNIACYLVQILQWRIDAVKFKDNQYSVRLLATKYFCTNKIVIKLPLVLYVDNLSNLLHISVREFSLVTNLLMCRVCKRRHKSRQSYTAMQFEHRLLCLPCLKNFFIPMHSLQRTWKLEPRHVRTLHSKQMVHKYVNLAVAVSHTSCSWYEALTNFGPVKMNEYWVNKEEMTQVLFNSSWNFFIHTNCHLPKIPYSRLFRRGFCEN